MSQELLSIKEASEWATKFLGRPITISNIQYLIQYARVPKSFYKNNVAINLDELKVYYEKNTKKEEAWKKRLGNDLNWGLSFSHLKESDTTKHVHRLHPYKGKFIPQLVEYFLDSHLNTFKKEVFFKSGEIILDPFMGSGTTLVQSSELGLHSIGIDISDFNCLISKGKVGKYNLSILDKKARDICFKTREFSQEVFDDSFDEELKEKLNEFNKNIFLIRNLRKRFGKG